MGLRATPAEVRTLLGVPNTADVDLYISHANIIVDEELTAVGFSETRLTLIETYLAAHFAALAFERGPLAVVAISDVKDSFHDIYSEGLGATRFGQQAMVLDTSGVLTSMSSNLKKPLLKRAEFKVV